MRRLCAVPGVGPVTAGAVMAFTPDLRAFSSGRNLLPSLTSCRGKDLRVEKTRLGGVSKMGQTGICKLLIVGAMSRIRWVIRKSVLPANCFGQRVGRKPRMVTAVALANKMARIIWAIMTGGGQKITGWRARSSPGGGKRRTSRGRLTPARRSTDDLCGKDFNVKNGENQSGSSSTKLSEPMWTLFFELHTGPVAQATIRGLSHER